MRLTAHQTATHLQISPKTFAKLVASKQIPYISVGRSKRFDLSVVEAYLTEVTPEANNVVQFQSVRKRTKGKSKFAEAVGL